MYLFNFHSIESKLRFPERKPSTMTREGLLQFIRTIRLAGLEVVSLQDVVNAGGPQALSAHQAVLTFDDGFENFYTQAAPVLLAEHCPATVFVLPGKFSGTNDWDLAHLPVEQRDRLMSLSQMQSLAKSHLFSFGSHGMHHRHLPQLSPEALHDELFTSFDILSRELAEAFVPVFAYPYGDYSPPVLAAMKTTPYRFAFTVEPGEWLPQQAPYITPRYPTCYQDGNPLFLTARLFRHRIGFQRRKGRQPVT